MDLAAFDAELARERAAAGLPDPPPPPPPPPATGGAAGGAPKSRKSGGTGARARSAAAAVAAATGGNPVAVAAVLAADPSEPVYCYCQRVSYGDMVACDNPDCAVEWFHYECAGVTEPPKGKWFCRDCAPAQKEDPVTE